MEEATSLNWELMGHGLTNSVLLTGLSKEKEAPSSPTTRAIIEALGPEDARLARPRAWRKLDDTLDLLHEHGVEYVCDWVNDDLPYRMNNGLYSIPYSLELNDMPLFNMPSIGIDDFYRRICETIRRALPGRGGRAAG